VTVRAAYLVTLLVVVAQVLILELAPSRWIQQPANVVIAVILGFAAWRIADSRLAGSIVCALAATPALLEMGVPYGTASIWVDFAKEGMWAAAPLVLAAFLANRLLQETEVQHFELWGAIALYLLLGLGLANVHELIHLVDPGSYIFQNLEGSEPSFSEFLYFSFVTLGTLGYGDVAPVTRLARLVSMMEALVGLMYVAVVVGRVVSLHSSRHAVAGMMILAVALGSPLATSAQARSSSLRDDFGLTDTPWRFVEFVSMSDEVEPVRPEAGRLYILVFESDGSFSAQLDCNRAAGSWSTESGVDAAGGRLAIGPVALTRALCPPPNTDQFLATQLDYVRSFTLRDGRLYLSLMADAGIMEFAPFLAAPEEGGPRNWEVEVTTALRLRGAPSTDAEILDQFGDGSILSNLGCAVSGERTWCDVQPMQGGPRGFVAASYLRPAVAPDGVPHFGADDSPLRAGQGDFDARGSVQCEVDGGEAEWCEFSVARAGGGYATVVIERPDGGRRAIFFTMGTPVGADLAQADGDMRFSVERVGDDHLVRTGRVVYRIPDAVVLGG
jgi:heat shock protein HslJ